MSQLVKFRMAARPFLPVCFSWLGLLGPLVSTAAMADEPEAATAAEQQEQARGRGPEGSTVEPGDVHVLQGVTVQGSYSGAPTVQEEAATSYTVRRSSNATKLDLSIKETPQSLTIITEKQIQDQNLTQVADVLKVTPGISVQEYGVPGAGRASYYARGYEIDNFQIDGMPTAASMFGGADLMGSMDSAIYERVEIIRGSTGLTTGTGDPSASINFVRKRPHCDPKRRLNLSYGTWSRARTELDVNQPLLEDCRLRGRFVGVYSEGEHWMDRVEDETSVLYGMLEADLTWNTTLWAGFHRFEKWVDDATPHGTDLTNNSGGIYDLVDAKGRAFNAATQWSYASQEVEQYFAGIGHYFNDDWRLNVNYQYTEATPDRVYGMVGADYYDTVNQLASFTYGRIQNDNEVHNVDVTLTGKFRFLGRDAQIATGFSGFRSEILEPARETQEGNPISLDNWNDGDIPLPKVPGTDYYVVDGHGILNKTKEEQYGAFFSTKFNPSERLTAILGVRYHKYDMGIRRYYYNGCSGAVGLYYECDGVGEQYSHEHVDYPERYIPYAGLVFALTPRTSMYASYTGIHKIQQESRGISARVIEEGGGGIPVIAVAPKKGNTLELGVKSALNDDRLNLQAAVFRMEEKDVAYSLPSWKATVTEIVNGEEKTYYLVCNNPYNPYSDCQPAGVIDGLTTMGAELSIAGQINDRWMINAGYTYLHLDSPGYSEELGYDPYETLDRQGFNSPKHSFSLFTSYALHRDFTVGGGVSWKSRTKKYGGGTWTGEVAEYVQGSYAVVDLMARYRLNRVMTLGLNVGNLFDETYLANDRASYYGAPRSITASLSATF
ncbi:TonB-dependent siderophore receptor [Alcanivorax sp. 24]|uniref:TonB-dependent siderophore receptor n=1 Tax=Alcanivorax sp. 24 TaxID=2545266 RepID=UPI00105DE0E8|nr:TonB-dependent receptor [Alcanivorax sp. 24]